MVGASNLSGAMKIATLISQSQLIVSFFFQYVRRDNAR